MNSRLILAIDQGTTGSRAILYDPSGKIRSSAYREFTQYYPRPGWVEHDPVEILESVRQVVRAASKKAQVAEGSISAIGITNQRETVVLWHRNTGRPIGRAIVWQDRRTAHLCEALRRKGLESRIRKKTGLLLDPYFSATKLKWLFDREKRLRSLAAKNQLCAGTIDSWLLFHLTGKKVHATDFTNASRTLLFDIRKRRWDPLLLKIFGVPKSALPKALPSNSLFGHTNDFAPLRNGIPIHAIVGDQQAALYGQGCCEAGTSKNTYGTGCFLLAHLGHRFALSKSGLLTTLACDRKGNPAYALEASIFIAGAAIQWLRDGLKLIKNAAETELIAQKTKTSGGVVVIPAFTGLGAPYWKPDARGAIFGLTRGTTREMIVKATLESVALQVAEVFELFEKEAGIKIRSLKADGGAAKNRYLMQFQADSLGVPVLSSEISELTAWGVAKLAGRASGAWKDSKTLDCPLSYRRFQPKINIFKRQSILSNWKEAVKRLLG